MANKIPVRTLKRMPLYLNYLEDLSINGVEYISAPKIASDLNYNEVSVKKDLSYITSKNGRPKIGHYVNDLICDLKEIIGYNINKKAKIKCPSKAYVKKYKKLFNGKTGYKKTMKLQ